jgi:glutamyl-tRNA reductase
LQILMTGLSHRTAPLATREALSLTRNEYPAAIEALLSATERGVIISTCNRTEIYTVATNAERGKAALGSFLEEHFPVRQKELRPYLYTLEQDEAVRHLFRVASGLDSLILGESEILGQVRDAFGIATAHGGVDGVLAHVFHSALRTGKRARTETEIGRNALSVSRACVELCRRVVGELPLQRALIVGVGEASRLAAVALRDAGVRSLMIANRTPENARELAEELGAGVASLEEFPHTLAAADIIVSATGAADFVVTRAQVEEAIALRGGEHLLMIDMAAPRDIDPSVAAMDRVAVYTLDDLEAIAEANKRERQAEATKVERIIDEEVERFSQWWGARGVTPTIAAIRHHAEELRSAEVFKSFAGVDGLPPDHAAKVDAMTKALVKKLLHDPTKALHDRKDESFTQSARELFGLDEE